MGGFHHVYGFLSDPFALPETVDLTWNQPEFTALGSSVCGTFAVALAIGDLDGDGIDDLAIGDQYFNDSAGRVLVVFGTDTPPDPWRPNFALTNAEWTIEGDQPDGMAGRSLAVGDLDGDGIGDLIIGGFATAKNATAGVAYVYRGGAHLRGAGVWSIKQNLPDTTIVSDSYNDDFGGGLLTADIDQDGIDEVIVAARESQPTPGNMRGRVYVVRGKASFFAQPLRQLETVPAEWTITGGAMNGTLGDALYFGALSKQEPALLWLGDASASPFQRQNAGAVVGLAPPSLATPTTTVIDVASADAAILGGSNYFALGSAIAISRDANGAGTLWLGQDNASSGGLAGNGEAIVLDAAQLEANDGIVDLATVNPRFVLAGESDGDVLGNAIFVGDLDGSGSDDVAVAAWYARHENREDAGKVYLFRDPFFEPVEDDDTADDDAAIDDDATDDDIVDDDTTTDDDASDDDETPNADESDDTDQDDGCGC